MRRVRFNSYHTHLYRDRFLVFVFVPRVSLSPRGRQDANGIRQPDHVEPRRLILARLFSDKKKNE